MSTAMDRAREIELAETAEKRARERMAKWNSDPKVKASVRRNHETIREMKAAAPAKRA
jgi:hypothetical protein